MNKLDFSQRYLAVCRYLMAIVILLGLSACTIPRFTDLAGDIEVRVPPVVAATQDDNITVVDVATTQGDIAVLRLQPATQQFDVGNTATVEIRIDNATNLVGVDIELQFDPGILQVQDVDQSQNGTQIQLGDFLATDYVVANEADNNTGIVRFILNQINTPPANGNGLLALVTFIGFSPGDSALTFSIVKLVTNDEQPLDVTAEPGQITVTQPAEEPSTPIAGEPTMTPTNVGEPTMTPTEPVGAAPPTDTPVPVELTPTSSPGEPTATPVEPAAPPPQPTETPVATTMPENLPPWATLGFCYRVQLDDTFYSLTYKFEVSAHALNLVNDLWPRNYVFAHQALFIPTHLGHGPNFYRVESGDTLTNIAERCHLPVTMIARVNNLDPAATVTVDQILEIPIPPFPPPSRYNYPVGPIPLIPRSSAPYPHAYGRGR